MENRTAGLCFLLLVASWGLKFHFYFFCQDLHLGETKLPEVIIPTSIKSLAVENFPQGSGEGGRASCDCRAHSSSMTAALRDAVSLNTHP